MNSVGRAIFACTLLTLAAPCLARATNKPNIVIVVADDMGWRDTGYSGNPIVKTPNLDAMAAGGVPFEYFYAAQQSCSPGRYAILTGRAPFRSGQHPLGRIRPQEITLAKALKTAGYGTGHFGKWHIGRGDTSPLKMGFDEAIWRINYYDLGASLQVGDSEEMVPLAGDSSVATMALALEFIRKRTADEQPFFVQVSLGSPHHPHRAVDEFTAPYKNLRRSQQHFWGEITGVDAAVGDLRKELRKLGIANDTIVWFTSDNGGITKESMDPTGKGKGDVGVRTVAVLEWPARVKQAMPTSVPASHMDMYPTLLDIAGVELPGQPVLDGISLLPLFEGKMSERPTPLGFMLRQASEAGPDGLAGLDFVRQTQGVWIDGKYKLIVGPSRPDGSSTLALYDIYRDPAEQTNLAEAHPDIVQRLRPALDAWRASLRASYDGADFPNGE
jgi:arylsulfatase A-like enzyme